MNIDAPHPLIKHGVMTRFSIGKTISNAELKRMAKKLNVSEDSSDFQDQLRRQIIKETQLAIFNNKIPGLITNQKVTNHVEKKPTVVKNDVDAKKRLKLALFATMLVQKILEQNLTSEEQCFVIVKLVGGLGIHDTDFQNYHRKNNKRESPEEDDNSGDDDQ